MGFQAWLEEAAEQHLDLVEADLTRERLRLEQRLHRLEAVQRRMSDEQASQTGVQRNLFDCFEPVGDAAFSAIGRRSSEAKVKLNRTRTSLTQPVFTSTSFRVKRPTIRCWPSARVRCSVWWTRRAVRTKAWRP